MNWTLLLIVAAFVVGVFLLKRMSFVSADVARQCLQQGALVVDVRSTAEFRSRHLPDAVNVPLDELDTGLPRLVKDKSRVLLLHCLSGARSGMAKQQLRAMGYTNAFNLGSYRRAQEIVNSARNQ